MLNRRYSSSRQNKKEKNFNGTEAARRLTSERIKMYQIIKANFFLVAANNKSKRQGYRDVTHSISSTGVELLSWLLRLKGFLQTQHYVRFQGTSLQTVCLQRLLCCLSVHVYYYTALFRKSLFKIYSRVWYILQYICSSTNSIWTFKSMLCS